MKDLEFCGIGFRLIGIVCIIFAIGKTAEGVNAIYQFNALDMGLNPATYKITVWVPILIIYVVGLALVKFPISIAKIVLPRTSSQTENINISQNTITIAGTTILGVYLLTMALPDLAFNILLIYQQYNYGLSENFQITETFIYLVSTGIEFGLGLYLVFGSKGLLNFIHKIRN